MAAVRRDLTLNLHHHRPGGEERPLVPTQECHALPALGAVQPAGPGELVGGNVPQA